MVSVIVPVYKVEPYLRMCIESVLTQTYSDFELILVDDGSPDRCGDICDEYAQKDGRVIVIHQSNSGLSAARNAGLECARGEWVTFIDSDDAVNDTYLADLLTSATSSSPISIACTRETDGVRELSVLGKELPDEVAPEEVYEKCNLLAVWAWGKLYRRDLIGSIRFPVGKIQEDEFFTYQVLFKVKKVAIAHAAVYNYLHRKDSIVGGKWYPGRLVAIEGMKQQLDFFDRNGFVIAAKHVRRRIIRWLATAIISIRRDCPNEIETMACVRNELKAFLLGNKFLLAEDPQLEYEVFSAKYPGACRFIRGYYVLRQIQVQGVAAVLRKAFNRLKGVGK